MGSDSRRRKGLEDREGLAALRRGVAARTPAPGDLLRSSDQRMQERQDNREGPAALEEMRRQRHRPQVISYAAGIRAGRKSRMEERNLQPLETLKPRRLQPDVINYKKDGS